jgi:hypothetical protein
MQEIPAVQYMDASTEVSNTFQVQVEICEALQRTNAKAILIELL